MKTITSSEQLTTILNNSEKYFIYKHSTVCSISAGALEEMNKFEKEFSSIPIYQVLVIENRPLSLNIADHLQVRHQSPQLLLIENKKCLWHISHLKIKSQIIKEQLETF